MGVSSSKHNAPPPSSEAIVRSSRSRSRSRSNRTSTVLKSSCIGSHQSDNDEPQVSDCPSEENCNTRSRSSENKPGSCQVPAKCYSTDEAEQSDDTNYIASDIELDEWAESRFNGTVSRDGNTSSRALSSRSLNPPSRFLSRFSFYPGNLSFRLTRSNSLGPIRAHSAASTSYSVSNDEEQEHPNRHERPQGCDFFPACFANRSSRMRHEQPGNPSGVFSDNLQGSRQMNIVSSINHIESDGDEIRHGNRRFAAREPTERNVRFSRTLSVGRLRDRVLRRTHIPDLDLYSFQQDGEVTRTQGLGHATAEATSEDDSISNPFYGSQNNLNGTPRVRETRYRDLLEHRSNFLERRRRIRSQVRALQRLGSRFENLSSRERSCILSGQHQSGHCTCHIAARGVNSNDDATARASISRIVVLAEALFEVLDEIHQQSVVLSSRPSVSSIGSIPASNEVVDSLPLKIFSKLRRKTSEEAAQCYICLVEYEEGDSMRVLPCHHEFHRTCVDKWLKEVHRVCPLCRGDICRPESLTAGN